jgi:hypothetical protein
MGPEGVPSHASSGGTVPAVPAAQPAAVSFSSAELRNLLAPIALYPDPLLAQILPASAYPLQIVLAQHWLDRNKARVAKGDFSGVDGENWDPSVKALARFPAIIKRMSDDLEWTIDLGDAEVNQPFNVAEVIQQLRAEAEEAGSLKITPEQTVTISSEGGESLIVIEPAEPSTIYVPNYDWTTAYGSPAPLIFSAGIAIGAWQAFDYWRWCDWRTGAILVWAGRPGTHPPYPGWRPGQPACTGSACDALNADIDASLKPWRPNADYRAGLGSKPGVGANRLGGVGGPVQPPGAERGPGRPAIGARGARQAPLAIGASGQGQLGAGAASLRAPAETFAPERRFDSRFARREQPAGLFAPQSLRFGVFMPTMPTPPGPAPVKPRSPIGRFAPPGRLSPGLAQPGRLAPGSPMTPGLPPMLH